MSRLDRLMTAKVIAQLGAVIGRQFSYGLLQAVSQLDEVMLQNQRSPPSDQKKRETVSRRQRENPIRLARKRRW